MIEQERARLVELLRPRLTEITDASESRVTSVAVAPICVLGFCTAITECIDCWLYALERGERWSGPAPTGVVLHARRAARSDVGLPQLQRRYMEARDTLWHTMLEEIKHVASSETSLLLRQAWAATESVAACVLSALEHAYTDEQQREAQTAEQRQAGLVRRLLVGDQSVDTRLIRHDFAGSHLAVIATGGQDARRALQSLAERVGAGVFSPLPERDGVLAAWLRLARELRPVDIERYLPKKRYPELSLAIGRSDCGLDGFCRTYELAREAVMVAQRRPQRITWHANVELDVLLLRDEPRASDLIANYLAPLTPVVKDTLRAYYAEQQSPGATAKVLRVHRSTVFERLRKIDQAIGRPLAECHFNVQLALRAEDLGIASTRSHTASGWPKNPTNVGF
jgi:hypothetical protein